MQIKEAVVALGALAQETRLAAYRLLVEAGPEGVPAGRIAELLAVAPAALSFHLKELKSRKACLLPSGGSVSLLQCRL